MICKHPTCNYISKTDHLYKSMQVPCVVCRHAVRRDDCVLVPVRKYPEHPPQGFFSAHTHGFCHAECAPKAMRRYYTQALTQ